MAKHGKTLHEKSFNNFERPYETNIIGLKGVFIFGGFLLFLIVLTFGLMYFLQNVMEEQSQATKDKKNPMMMSEVERLPPEPRLQAAPGYGVESEKGFVSLELKAPQSEYRVLKSQWERIWKDGQKDVKTGMVITMPIAEAEKKLIEQSAAASGGSVEESQKFYNDSRRFVSGSNAGRMAMDIRR